MYKFKAILRAIFYRLPKPGDTYEEDIPKRNPWAKVLIFRILETKTGGYAFHLIVLNPIATRKNI